MTAPRLFTLPIAAKEDLGAGYFVLRFSADEPIAAAAGQFAMVRGSSWSACPLLPRPMSLLTAGRAPSILVKVAGAGTARMAQAVVGDRFEVLAPLGRAWPPLPEGGTAVLVAGGVGVAPLIFLAAELRAQEREVVALYGGRTARDLPLAEELATSATLQLATEDGSRGAAGRVTLLLDRLLGAGAGRLTVYCCGPHAMMAAVSARCEAAQVPCRASLEAPMACGYGVCLGCAVARRAAGPDASGGGYLYACVDGPCVDAAAVDWSARVW